MTKVVVTGIGLITSNAGSFEEFSDALRKGDSGIKDISLFDSSKYKARHMGEISDFVSADHELDRASQLALHAARQAVDHAGKEGLAAKRLSMGVAMGTNCGGITTHEKIVRQWRHEQEAEQKEMDEVCFHVMAGHIARELQLEGPVTTITIACASGANAVGYAADLIRRGQADVMLAGGSDTVSNFTFSGFSVVRSVARDKCKPFDENRLGIALGEGAGVLVLEREEDAQKRGATIYGEILGYGFSNDAYHSTAPDPRGRGMVRSIDRALEMAGLAPDDIGYVNAHGTGTKANDAMELCAYDTVFGKNNGRAVSMSSIKSMIGHTLGAAGAIEIIATIAALNGQFAPPTINTETVPEACRLSIVRQSAVPVNMNYALCCNAGFAGNNAAVVVGR